MEQSQAEDRLRPQLVLRIGVTGHRPPRLDRHNSEKIQLQCDKIFEACRKCLDEIHSKNRSVFSSREPLLELVTPLAAGADTIAAKSAHAQKMSLEAALPLAPEQYRAGFDKEDWAEVTRLLGHSSATFVLDLGQKDESQAFEQGGRLVVAQSDILIAIWDGDEARGKGGTTQIVEEAIAEHLPVIHVDAAGDRPSTLLWSGIEEVIPDSPSLEGVGRIDALEALPALVEALVEPPQEDAEADALKDFLEEEHRHASLGFSWPLLLFVAGVNSLTPANFRGSSIAQSAEGLAHLTAMSKAKDRFARHLRDSFAYRFALADAYADSFALRFRGSFVRNFALAALAVLLALSGLLWPQAKTLLISAELAVILAIIFNTRRANRGGLHQKWLDHRHLAERLRLLVLPAFLGMLSLREVEDGTRIPGWISWYSRACARELGLPQQKCDTHYLEQVRQAALDLINDQAQYHTHTRRVMKHADHRLHTLGDLLFAGTILACLGWLGTRFILGFSGEIGGIGLSSWVTFITALFPALAAALYGIRMQGDFANSSRRSDAIAKRLDQLKYTIECEKLSYGRLSQRLQRLSEIMLADVEQWRSSYQARPLMLPG